MPILVLNSGSSSIKFSIFAYETKTQDSDPICLLEGEIDAVGAPESRLELRAQDARLNRSLRVPASGTLEAACAILQTVGAPGMPEIEAVGYRVVHPGPRIKEHVRITADVLREIEEAVAFAPLHDPAVVAVIHEGLKRFPAIEHFACFDTVFHNSLPAVATTYAIPAVYRASGVRRYGFHGLSCESVVRQLKGSPHGLPQRLILAHLGSGCSVTAVRDGSSIDTSMGLTPTGGVVMGTRPGDLDPGLLLYLLRQQAGLREEATAALEGMLNHTSGVAALAEMPNSMKDIRAAAAAGVEGAVLAVEVFVASLRKAIGGFCWTLGGVDAVVFTGGIGEHDAETRSQTLNGLEAFGIVLDASLNAGDSPGTREIQAPESKVKVVVVPAQEDLMIALHVGDMQRESRQ